MAPRKMIGRRSNRPSAAPRPAPRSAAPPRQKLRSRGPAGPPLLSLLLVPAAVTLGVTLLRLAGELLEWSPQLFSRAPGGGMAAVGIAWLVPIFGYLFGEQLGQAGFRPSSMARAAGVPAATLVLLPALATLVTRMDTDRTFKDHITVWAVASMLAVAAAFLAWPALGRVLLAYSLAARLPVVAIMWAAMRWNWRTHYDAPPPGLPSMIPMDRWWWTGVVPQMTIWVAWTVVVGTLFGALGWYVASRQEA